MRRSKMQIPALLPAALLVFSLAACSGTAPAAPEPTERPAATAAPEPTAAPAPTPDPTPEPTPEPTKAPANALSAPYYEAHEMGETVLHDLNGDGKDEEISVALEKNSYGNDAFRILINGKELAAAWYAGGGCFDSPDETCWLLTDVDASDNMLEIAVQDWGPSDDLTTHFFRWEWGALTDLGEVEGFILFDGRPADAELDGKGCVSSYMRLHVLQTWWAAVQYRLDSDGSFSVQEQELYYADRPASDPQRVMTLCDLSGYTARSSEPETIPAGTELAVLATDDIEWVLVRSVKPDKEFWLHLDDERGLKLETPDGWVYSWDALDGLSMAD